MIVPVHAARLVSLMFCHHAVTEVKLKDTPAEPQPPASTCPC